MNYARRNVFRPISFLYFGVLLLWLIIVIPVIGMFFRDLLVRGVGIPPEYIGLVLFVSLVGSSVNLPLTTIESRVPIYSYREVKFFMVNWRIPTMEMGVRKTMVTINVGGALVPLIISGYLLFSSIPLCSVSPVKTYIKVLVVLTLVSLLVNRSARIVKGLGIATPAFMPPLITALSTLLVNAWSPGSCLTQVAYIGGTIGTLIGADLMNLHKIADIGAPMVSIGGAGTFDGIYITGLMSVVLVILLV